MFLGWNNCNGRSVTSLGLIVAMLYYFLHLLLLQHHNALAMDVVNIYYY